MMACDIMWYHGFHWFWIRIKVNMSSAIFHLTWSKPVWIHTGCKLNDWGHSSIQTETEKLQLDDKLVNSTYKLNNDKCAHWVLETVSRLDALSLTPTMPRAGIIILTIQLKMRAMKWLTKTTYLVNRVGVDSKPGYVWFQTFC